MPQVKAELKIMQLDPSRVLHEARLEVDVSDQVVIDGQLQIQAFEKRLSRWIDRNDRHRVWVAWIGS